MNILGECSSDKLAIISSDATSKQIVIPSYNATDFKITNAYLKGLSSSGGQTYEVNSSIDAGNNTGFNFNAVPSSRDLYWIGGQGDFDDAQHWSLTSGGTPIVDCFPPRATDNVFFDVNSGFTAAQNRIYISGNRNVKNMTFDNALINPFYILEQILIGYIYYPYTEILHYKVMQLLVYHPDLQFLSIL
jgi:hypothetical protein